MADKPAWHEAYPTPRNQRPDAITREELLTMFQKHQMPGIDFLLVDLRRTDHEGGTVRGSINLPAQNLYHSLPTLLNLCQGANIKTVIWYCGSSRGRGTRAAGWFDDLISDRGLLDIRSVILLDGIAGWANAGEAYTNMMDEYNVEVWNKPKQVG